MKRKTRSIKHRLIMYFICIVIVPLFFVLCFMRYACQKTVMQLARNSLQCSLDIIDNNLTTQFLNYENLTYFISRDQQLRQLCTDTEKLTSEEADKYWGKMSELLNGYRQTQKSVDRIMIAYENGRILRTESQQPMENSAVAQEWYQLCREEPNLVHVLMYEPGDLVLPDIPLRSKMIFVCRAILDPEGRFLGVINLQMYSNVLAGSMLNILSGNGSFVYIKGEDGKIVYSPVVQVIPNQFDTSIYCIQERYNKQIHWNVVGVMYLAEYTKELEFMTRAITIMVICVVLIMAALGYGVGRSIVRPISSLCHLMKEVEQGNRKVQFTGSAPEEIKELSDSFNHMIVRVDELLKQVYTEQRAKRKAEIAALQANIKPHFLYNTLDTLHWMAMTYHATDIVEMVDALATLFRVSLSKGSDEIYVEQEMLHVKSYLQIQKVRYEDMIDYEIGVTQDCLNLKVQKLILQPLVENAIYHGIKESGRPGLIKVNVWRTEDSLMLMVADNGKGMSEERLNEVRAALNNFTPKKNGAYGVVNVHQRIVLSFGPGYGLTMESELGAGTVVVITHPILSEEKEHD